uniref:Uncharacterized protein n=1 Tax=Oryza brachyantha TaxID=4533 RepID=J3NE64_ORYBR
MERHGADALLQLRHRQACLPPKVMLLRHIILMDLDPQHSQLWYRQRECELLVPHWYPLILDCLSLLHHTICPYSSDPHLNICICIHHSHYSFTFYLAT